MSALGRRPKTCLSAIVRASGAPRGAFAAAAFLAAAAATSLGTSAAVAQDLTYCDLSVPQQSSKLETNGDAMVVSAGTLQKRGIRVTEEKAGQRSTVFHDIPIAFEPGGSFYQHFRVRISGGGGNLPPNGADGLAFILQNDPGGDPLGVGKIGTGKGVLGINGEGLGYGGVTQSLALELDTLQNAAQSDPDGNHVALLLGGLTGHTSDGTKMGTPLMAAAEGATVVPWQPVKLDPVMKSLESTAVSYDTRDVWIDYECAAPNKCSMKVYMTFNNTLLMNEFASSINPPTLPKRPDAPIMVVDNLKDLSTYLNGPTGFAGFSASTGGAMAMDEHLVTFWVLSRKPLPDADGNNLEDTCECKTLVGACDGNVPICDPSTPQGFCRDCLNDFECSAKGGLKPICDLIATGGQGACVECTNDTHCTVEEPYCNTAVKECTANCTADDMCPSEKWCDNPTGAPFGGTCVDDLENGSPIPKSENHNPPLDGTCSTSAAIVVCKSGVCDMTDNLCGYPVGGPCTMSNGALVCRSEVCSAEGTCICEDDGDCGDAASGRVCDNMTGSCRDGCRGEEGNGCPANFVCTSTTKEVGECKEKGTGPITPGSGGSVEGAGLFRCASGAGGPQDGGSGQGAALVILAALAGHLARRKRR
jgi:hypothetical protein